MLFSIYEWSLEFRVGFGSWSEVFKFVVMFSNSGWSCEIPSDVFEFLVMF